jgi:hypothetical protein
MHKRWDIENNVFHQLKTEWHLDHCFLHSHRGRDNFNVYDTSI